MRFLFTHSRTLALSGALLLLAMSAGSALADSTGSFWGWSLISGDNISYNLQIPPTEVVVGHEFLRVRMIGTHEDGNTFVICDQQGEFNSLSCSVPTHRFTSAWATVTYKDTSSGDGAIYNTGVLETTIVQDDPANTVNRLFTVALTPGGADENGNDNNGNDNSGNTNGNDNSGNANDNSASGNDNSGNTNGNDNSGNANDNSASGNDNSGNTNANDNSGDSNDNSASGNDNSGNTNANDNSGNANDNSGSRNDNSGNGNANDNQS